jgi:hypothetical protein
MDKKTQDKWNNIKSNRNGLLAQSDWTQLPDVNLTPELVEAMKTYRQQLRDITNTYINPDEVVFPENPLEQDNLLN